MDNQIILGTNKLYRFTNIHVPSRLSITPKREETESITVNETTDSVDNFTKRNYFLSLAFKIISNIHSYWKENWERKITQLKYARTHSHQTKKGVTECILSYGKDRHKSQITSMLSSLETVYQNDAVVSFSPLVIFVSWIA